MTFNNGIIFIETLETAKTLWVDDAQKASLEHLIISKGGKSFI